MDEKRLEMADLIKRGTVQDLIALPDHVFTIAVQQIKRVHYEAQGFRILDPDHPAVRENSEG